jgi:hypothetical protein
MPLIYSKSKNIGSLQTALRPMLPTTLTKLCIIIKAVFKCMCIDDISSHENMVWQTTAITANQIYK